jgi:hypothetical protein
MITFTFWTPGESSGSCWCLHQRHQGGDCGWAGELIVIKNEGSDIFGGFLRWVPPNHPFIDGFSTINHPFWGTPVYFTHTHWNLSHKHWNSTSTKLHLTHKHCDFLSIHGYVFWGHIDVAKSYILVDGIFGHLVTLHSPKSRRCRFFEGPVFVKIRDVCEMIWFPVLFLNVSYMFILIAWSTHVYHNCISGLVEIYLFVVQNWLVWNIWIIFPFSWECHHPNWLSLHHFSEG